MISHDKENKKQKDSPKNITENASVYYWKQNAKHVLTKFLREKFYITDDGIAHVRRIRELMGKDIESLIGDNPYLCEKVLYSNIPETREMEIFAKMLIENLDILHPEDFLMSFHAVYFVPPSYKRKEEIPAQLSGRELIDEIINGMIDEITNGMDDDLIFHRKEYLKAAERGNARKLQAIINSGFPVNYQDPDTGETALHIVAACQARKALKILLGTTECNYLLRDKKGRLASEMAFLYGKDVAVARLLRIKERKQAEKEDIKVTRRPKLGG